MTITDWFIPVVVGIATVCALVFYKRYLATKRFCELEKTISLAITSWHNPDGKDQYLTQPQHRRWEIEFQYLIRELRPILHLVAKDSVVLKAQELVEIWDGKDTSRIARNEAWVNHQRKKHENLFANGLGYQLNSDQIDAILYDEHRGLVVAGAGTGKTSTVVAKARWILEQDLAEPSRIRILAFNKKAAEEIGERLGKEVRDKGVSSTFHALGLAIVAQARGRMPRLTVLAEDKKALQTFLRKCVDDGLMTPEIRNHVIEFLAYFRYPEPHPVPIERSHEANRWAEGLDIRSLTGVKLRSNSEVIIANWMTLNSIKWEYEKDYEIDTTTIRYGQYRPDFYLPEHRIYIEHWACNENGQFPPTWSQEQQTQYWEGMCWKRALHNRNETVLIETYSHRNGQKTIIETIERALISHGVQPIPLNGKQRNALIGIDGVIDPFVKLTQNFLKMFRESGMSIHDLQEKLDLDASVREQAFLKVFEWVHARYVDQIKSEQAIDFSDMIREAADALIASKVCLPIDYLIVDEFQDISRGRANLVKAILEQNPNCRLVAVGDDWQSINRFAGSDIELMVEFEEEFGFTKRTDLRQTHRFGTKLLAASSRFIEKNPQQLKKRLISTRVDQYPAIEILSKTETPQVIDDSTATALSEALHRIADADEKASVLVLGRYRDLKKQLNKAGKPKGLKIDFSTVHGAKGLEADYVVILNVVAGRLGFPSEIEDDPMMNLVLASQAAYPNAEERRVFYVALTRARIKSFVLSDDHRRSCFVDELESDEYEGLVIRSGATARVVECPVCKGGRLQLRSGSYGPYYACTSQLCNGKAAKCPHCGVVGFVRGFSEHTCLFCGKTADNCPKCTRGYLKHIPEGANYLAFDACSTNRKNYKCYVRNPCGCKTETSSNVNSPNLDSNFQPAERRP